MKNCPNQKGMRFMSHRVKLLEIVIEQTKKANQKIKNNQIDFMPKRSTMKAIYLQRRVMEQYWRD